MFNEYANLKKGWGGGTYPEFIEFLLDDGSVFRQVDGFGLSNAVFGFFYPQVQLVYRIVEFSVL
jgi:hypothetical protein